MTDSEAAQTISESPSEARDSNYIDFEEEGRKDFRAGLECTPDRVRDILAPSLELRYRNALTEKSAAEGREAGAKRRFESAGAEVRGLRDQNPKPGEYERASLLLALIYLLAATVFVLSDVALSKQMAGILHLYGLEALVFAVALALIGVLLEIYFYKKFAEPMYEDRQHSGADSTKVKKIRKAIIVLLVIGGASLAVVALGGYLRSEILLQPPASLDDIDDTTVSPEVEALENPIFRIAAVVMMIGTAVVFAVNSGLCLAMGLVYFQGSFRNGRRWIGYRFRRTGYALRKIRLRRRFSREESNMRSAQEAAERASIVHGHVIPIWEAHIRSAQIQYLRGYTHEKDLPRREPYRSSRRQSPGPPALPLTYESGRSLMLQSNGGFKNAE